MTNEKREVRRCSIEGCDRKHSARGWCKHHYDTQRAHGDPLWEPLPPKLTGCSVEGCPELHHARGLCAAHYGLQRHHGDPLWKQPPMPTKRKPQDHLACLYLLEDEGILKFGETRDITTRLRMLQSRWPYPALNLALIGTLMVGCTSKNKRRKAEKALEAEFKPFHLGHEFYLPAAEIYERFGVEPPEGLFPEPPWTWDPEFDLTDDCTRPYDGPWGQSGPNEDQAPYQFKNSRLRVATLTELSEQER